MNNQIKQHIFRLSGAAALVLMTTSVSSQTAPNIEKITVNGTKIKRYVTETDSAVSVRSSDALKNSGISGVQDLTRTFANLRVDSRGNRNYSNIVLRGISTGDFYNPTVQVYVDGVAQDPAFASQELLDVNQVELLRGPQGTLYGHNTQGGIINIVTNDSRDTKRYVKLDVSNYKNAYSAGASGEISESFSGSLALKYIDINGQINDIATGKNNIDNGQDFTGMMKLDFSPQDSPLRASLRVQKADIDSHEELYISDKNLDNLSYNSILQGGINHFKREVTSYALSVHYDLGWGTLSSQSALQDRDINRRLIQGFNTPESRKSLSQEIRLTIDNNDHLSSVIGVFYQDVNFERQTPVIDFGPPLQYGSSTNQIDATNIALFAEATYQVSDTVDFTAGLRWSQEKSDIKFKRIAPVALTINDHERFTDLSPKVAIGWQVNDKHRLYALASRGFKAGGFNNSVPLFEFNPAKDMQFNAEEITNYEAGWYGSLNEGRNQLRLSIYHIQTDNKQTLVGQVPLQIIANIGSAESTGIEFEGQFSLTERSTLTFDAALGKAQYKDAVDPITKLNISNKSIPHAPDISANIAIDHLVASDLLDGSLYARVGVHHVDKIYFDDINSLTQDRYQLINASLRLETEFGLTMRLYGNNLTDEVYRSYSYAQPSQGNFSTVGIGRNIGLNLGYKF